MCHKSPEVQTIDLYIKEEEQKLEEQEHEDQDKTKT